MQSAVEVCDGGSNFHFEHCHFAHASFVAQFLLIVRSFTHTSNSFFLFSVNLHSLCHIVFSFASICPVTRGMMSVLICFSPAVVLAHRVGLSVPKIDGV